MKPRGLASPPGPRARGVLAPNGHIRHSQAAMAMAATKPTWADHALATKPTRVGHALVSANRPPGDNLNALRRRFRLPSVAILLRDRHCCQVPGCRHRDLRRRTSSPRCPRPRRLRRGVKSLMRSALERLARNS
jgi:hypothetical protein